MANKPVPIPGKTAAAADQAAKANDALWYTFSGIGRAYLIQRGTPASGDANSAAVHGYNTIEQAYTNPNQVNWLSQPVISQWDAWASLPVGGGTLGVIETVNITAPSKPGQPPTISTPQNPTTAGAGAAGNDLGLAGIAGGISAFYHVLTDGKLWRSLAWILLGFLLIFTGLTWWIGGSAAVPAAGFVRRAYA